MATEGDRCLNCEAVLCGPYCFSCGQKVTALKPRLRELLGEFAAGFFSLDSRIFRTLRVLLLHPGFLTSEYNEGRRVRYVPPLRLYLAVSVLLFFLLAVSDVQVFRASVSEETRARAGQGKKQAPVVLSVTGVEEPAGGPTPLQMGPETFSEKAVRAAANPRVMNSIIVDRLPQALFLLVPLFALMVKVAYWRSGFVYAQHFVLVLHLSTFLFAVALLLLVFRLAGVSGDLPLLLAAPFLPIYFARSLLVVYGQSVARTVAKTLGLGIAYAITVGVSVLSLGMLAIYSL